MVLVSLMESSFLIEVDNTSILRTGALHCYHYTLNRLPAPRLLLPRSGLERSDFVPWPQAAGGRCQLFRCCQEVSRHPANGPKSTLVTQGGLRVGLSSCCLRVRNSN